MIKRGDQVRLKRIPPAVAAMLNESDEMSTNDVFHQCVGHVFRVRGISTNSSGADTGHVELWVHEGNDCDDEETADSIWVEPAYLERVVDHEGLSISGACRVYHLHAAPPYGDGATAGAV